MGAASRWDCASRERHGIYGSDRNHGGREDEKWIRNYLEQYGFETEVSKGFMCPDWTIEAYLEAELRRGIVFGKSDNVEN